jgi:hypothetical protein
MLTSARPGGKSAYNKIKKHKLSSTGEAILAVQTLNLSESG